MKTMTTEYKLLKAGDKIEPGDEVLMAGSRPDGDDWRPLRGMCGDFVKPENAGFIRRPVYKTTRCCGDTVEELIEENKKLKADLFAYGEFTTNVAKALGMGTYEIVFAHVVDRIRLEREAYIQKFKYLQKECDGQIDWKAHHDSVQRQANEAIEFRNAEIKNLKSKLESVAIYVEVLERDLSNSDSNCSEVNAIWERKYNVAIAALQAALDCEG